MKKEDLINAVVDHTGEAPGTVRSVFDGTCKAVHEAMASGDEVFLLGIGKLSVAKRAKRKARNLVTGESVVVPAHGVAKFRPSKSLAETVKKLRK